MLRIQGHCTLNCGDIMSLVDYVQLLYEWNMNNMNFMVEIELLKEKVLL